MWFRFRLALYLAVALVVVPAEIVFLSDVLDRQPTSSRAKAWVEANASALPSTLDEMSALPLPYRRRAFEAAPPDVKSALWKEHLGRVITNHPDLSTEKRHFLERARDALSAEVYSTPVAPHPKLAAFCEEASRILTDEERAWFGVLGPEQATYSTLQSKRLAIVEGLRDVFALHAQWPDCECSYGSWCSCWDCEDYGCGRFISCGCAWNYKCDGIC